jgi:hypothetical protein
MSMNLFFYSHSVSQSGCKYRTSFLVSQQLFVKIFNLFSDPSSKALKTSHLHPQKK